MKKISIVITASLFTFSLYNCAGSDDNHRTDEVETQEVQEENHDGHDDHENHGDDHGELSLNDGAKWKINEEMRPFVMEAEELIKDFVLRGSTDYKKLATEMKESNTKLIKSCTMTGTAHDELHNWLHPYMEELEELEMAENEEEAKDVVEDLMEAFEEFHYYFE